MNHIYIILYISAVFSGWKYTNAIYSKNGKYHDTKPGLKDLIYTFLPIVNVFYMMMWILKFPYINFNSFWGIETAVDVPEKANPYFATHQTIDSEIKKYVDLGVSREKIIFSHSTISIWSTTRDCLVGGLNQPPAMEVVQDGMLSKATYENNKMISVKTYSKLTDELINQINNSNGIVITKQSYDDSNIFRFDFIPVRLFPTIKE